jgi:hypothetical protein
VKRRGFLAGLVGALGLGVWGKKLAAEPLKSLHFEVSQFGDGGVTINLTKTLEGLRSLGSKGPVEFRVVCSGVDAQRMLLHEVEISPWRSQSTP